MKEAGYRAFRESADSKRAECSMDWAVNSVLSGG